MADYITKSNFINKQKNEIICVKGLRNYIEHCIEKTRSMDGKCVNKNFTEMLKVYGEQTVCDFYTGLKKTYDDKNWQFHFYNNVTRAYENAEKNGWCYCQHNSTLFTINMENRRFNWAVFEQECRREIEHLDAMIERIQGVINNLDRYLQTLKEVNEFAKKVRELPHEVTNFVDMERVGTSGFIHIA